MKKLVLVLAVAFAGGCSVGPNYVRPEVEKPDAWIAPDTTFYADSLTAKADSAWWELFGDTVLTNLIMEGLRENADVRIAAARVEELMGRYGVAKSDFFPKIDASGGAVYGEFGSSDDEVDVDRPARDYFRVDVSTDWEIDLWGKIRRANEAARADLLGSEEARRGVVLTTTSLIAKSYIDLLALDRQLEIARQTAESRRSAMDLFEQRRAKGDLSDLEYSQAESEYWLAMAQIPFFEKNITFVENTINFLVGRNPGPVPRGSTLEGLILPDIPVGMPSTLLERRPDVRFAEEQLRAANARIGVAKSRFFPSISLTGLLGFASGELSSLFKSAATIWDVGGNVVQPIFRWGEIRGDVKAAEGIQKQALYAYVGTVRNAFREAEDALVDRSLSDAQMTAEGNRARALTTYAELSRLRYDEGITSYLEVLDAERALFATQLDYTATRSEVYKSVVTIHQVLAGGWLENAAEISFQVEEDVETRDVYDEETQETQETQE